MRENLVELLRTGHAPNIMMAAEICTGQGLSLYTLVTGEKWRGYRRWDFEGELGSLLCEYCGLIRTRGFMRWLVRRMRRRGMALRSNRKEGRRYAYKTGADNHLEWQAGILERQVRAGSLEAAGVRRREGVCLYGVLKESEDLRQKK